MGDWENSWVLLHIQDLPMNQGNKKYGKWNWTPDFWICKAKNFNKNFPRQTGRWTLAWSEANPFCIIQIQRRHENTNNWPDLVGFSLSWLRSLSSFLSNNRLERACWREKQAQLFCLRKNQRGLTCLSSNHVSLVQSLPMCHTALMFRKVVVYQTLSSAALTWPSNFTRLLHPD